MLESTKIKLRCDKRIIAMMLSVYLEFKT